MSKIKDELLEYLERHDLDELPSDVTMAEVIEDNRRNK